MNDALVEMIGALAGFTITMGNSRLIILAGISTGVAATLSMACAEFLADEVEHPKGSPFIAASLTGITYLFVVSVLLTPYFLCASAWVAFCFTLLLGVLLIFIFTLGVSKIRNISCRQMFTKMLWVSAGVATAAFVIGWGANYFWGIPV